MTTPADLPGGSGVGVEGSVEESLYRSIGSVAAPVGSPAGVFSWLEGSQ